MYIEIRYKNRRGAYCVERCSHDRLFARLTQLRKNGVCDADVWTVDSSGVLIDRIGGNENWLKFADALARKINFDQED